jgi:serine protease Do
MTDVEREPCPRCGEPAAIAGRVCRHCSASLLVDVAAAGPIADPRARYRAARDLAGLLPGAPLPRIREALSRPEGGVVAARLTREQARPVLALLQSHGGTGRTVEAPLAIPEDVPDLTHSLARSEGLGRAAVLVAAAVALIGGGVWFLSRRTGAAPPHAAEARPSALPSSAPTRTTRDVAANALSSMAALRCGSSGGAGFFVTPELLVTNAHVLCGPRASLEVRLPDGRRLEGAVASRDEWLDLAIVRVAGAAMRPLPLGDAMAIEPGDGVLFVGSPLGMDFTVSRAIVSHPRRNVYGVAFVQFDANVNRGNSGGPLLDGEGRAIGVVSMMLADSRGLAFALPVNYLYDLPGAPLPVPVPPPDFEAWRRTLASVHRQDLAEADEVRQSFRRPALGAAAVDADGRLYAVVVTRGQPAGTVPYRFAVRRAGRILCGATGLVNLWGPVTSRETAADPRFLRWLSRIDLGTEVSSGSAELSLDGCPEARSLVGAELLLEGAETGSGRAVIDVVREVN